MAANLTDTTHPSVTPPRSRSASTIGHLCAIGVAGFFIYAATQKCKGAAHVMQFAQEIGNYKLWFMAEQYLHIPAILMPWIELTAAIGLLIPATRKGAALVIGGMLLFFVYAIYDAAIVRHLKIKCGCTGDDSSEAGWWTIARNFLLLAATIASVYLPTIRRKPRTDEVLTPVSTSATAT